MRAPLNFAVIGAAGYVAPRHLRAIRDTNNRLVAAVDPKDSVGILDQYGFEVKFFTEIERFDRHLEKLRRGPEGGRVQYVSICSPNYLHDAHCRLALRAGANVICEKPLVINPWNLDRLEELETETRQRICTMLQLRVHPRLLELKRTLESAANERQHDVILTNVTGRGNWYQVSWKGQEEKSGGLASNIGIHFFDVLIWLFGAVQKVELHQRDTSRMSGMLELRRARVRWFLSVDPNDIPHEVGDTGRTTFRSLKVDDHEIELSDLFDDLHTRVYEETLAGRGFGIGEARASIELTHRIRMASLCEPTSEPHPLWRAKS